MRIRYFEGAGHNPEGAPRPLDIEPGSEVDFAAAGDGIRLRKVVNRRKQSKVLGCLKAELAGHTLMDIPDELRGPVELPKGHLKRNDK